MATATATPVAEAARSRPALLAAWALWSTTLLLVAVSAVLLAIDFSVVHSGGAAGIAAVLLTAAVYPTVGGLIGSRLPRNPIGWLLSTIGVALALTVFAEQYALRGLLTAPGSLPAPRPIGSLGNGADIFAVGSLLLVVLLFPDGHPPSRRWRPILWLAIAVDVWGTVGFQLQKGEVDGLTNSLKDHHVAFRNSLGLLGTHGAASVALGVTGGLGILCAGAAVVGLFLRRRRGRELRQQLAWLGYVGVIAAVAFVAAIPVSNAGVVSSILWGVLFGDILIGIPLACGVAILRYRLYELDIVVKKTVVFGGLLALFTAVYAAVVIGVGAAVGHRGNAALTFAGAAVAAILFQPARSRVRRLADRLVYGERATPYEMLSEFSERLAGAYSTEDVLPRMAQIVATGTGATSSSVWLHVGDEFLPAASFPPGVEPAGALRASDGGLPASLARDAVEVRHQGDLLGALTVAMPPSDPMNPAKEKLIADVARQAGLVLRNVRLTEELKARIDDLRASRQRLVTAQDEERRRLERNIHDGAQQQLVALAVKQRLAQSLVRKDPEKAAQLLSQLQEETTEALDNLRELARGIYPPLLADKGLAAALEGQARRGALPVRVDAPDLSRYPREVEAAVYFCCLEALQNVAKYAHASTVVIAVTARDGGLRFEVSDDGVGYDAEGTPLGSGLRNMADRLAALGGSLEVKSTPGSGTTVIGELPVNG